MSKAPAAPAKAEADAAPAGGGKSKLVLILLAVLVVILLAGGGAAAWFFTHQSSGKATAGKKVSDDEDAGKPPVFLPLDPPFTVNLTPDANSGDSEKYLQVAMTIQVSDDKASDNFKAHMPLIRSRILMLLSAQKASVLLTEDGKNALIKNIEAQLTTPFDTDGPKQKIRGVFFTSFVIQ